MILGAAVQQPRETLDYDVDYTEWFGEQTDTLETFTAVAEPEGLSIVATPVDGIFGKVWISGGEDGVTYLVTVTAVTDKGRIKEDEFELIMQDFR